MICDVCGKIATYHHSITINGVTKQQHLCAECAIQKEGEQSSIFQIGDLLDHFQQDYWDKGQIKCISCDCTFEEFKQSGIVGCAKCYETFYQQILPAIERVQGSTQYVGKKLNLQESRRESEIAELEQRLQECVQKEDYETAAYLQRQIRELKGE